MDSGQHVMQDMFGVSRLLVLYKYFINQNYECILTMFSGNMFEVKIFSNTFSEKSVYVIVNDVDGLATTSRLEKFDVTHCAAWQNVLLLFIQ